MRKRIIPLLAALCLLLCLLPSAALAAEIDGTVDQSRSYNFVLTAEKGQTEVKATTGEVITVSLVLKRTDSAESADMYGMQTEIEYDDTFLQLVEGSVMTVSGVRWNDLGRRTGGRAFYLNFVSFQGGEPWESEVLVGSFQMKVIGTAGVSQLIPTNTLVSTQDGMAGYAVQDNSVSVIVTTDCTVTFESNGGTEVPSQTVRYGEKVKKPDDPVREGYHLEGWYSDLDRTQKWDFHKDVVKGNMTLYANWTEGAAGGTIWWIVGGVGLLALLLILLLLLGKKKVRFETSGGTELEAISVKRGSVIGEVMTPTKPGAAFGGWYADAALTKPWDTLKDPVRSSMTLYARWM